MEKIKNIITGILSVAVFFMAVQVGVAHQKASLTNDKTEAIEHATGNVFAMVVAKANNALIQKKSSTKVTAVEVMNDLSIIKEAQSTVGKIDSKTILEDLQWFPVTVIGSENPANQQITGEPIAVLDPGCDELNTGDICAVQLDLDAVTDPQKQDELADILMELETDPSSTNYTIADLIALGATVENTARSEP